MPATTRLKATGDQRPSAKHTEREISRGCIRLGKLIEWDDCSLVRFFYTDAKHGRFCEDFDSLGHFEQWLAQELGVPRDGQVIRGTRVDQDRTQPFASLNPPASGRAS